MTLFKKLPLALCALIIGAMATPAAAQTPELSNPRFCIGLSATSSIGAEDASGPWNIDCWQAGNKVFSGTNYFAACKRYEDGWKFSGFFVRGDVNGKTAHLFHVGDSTSCFFDRPTN